MASVGLCRGSESDMASLTASDFPAFFEAVHGFSPFPWQTRLASGVAEAVPGTRPWPEVLALPTASGKTCCIDIAVFALAVQADRPAGDRTAARRVFFVVDRRIIVDEAYEHACRLAARLSEAQSGIPRQVADALRRLAGGETPLACTQLRGGLYRDEAWARSPLQPTVVASTVDQVGSRLFYRGYGLSTRSAAIHAGLVANDALMVLDEAHCANPFRQTLTAISRYRQWAAQPVEVPFDVLVMTATPRTADPSATFGPDEADFDHAILGRRLSAQKPARLLEVPGKSHLGFAEALALQARRLVSSQRRAIAVIVNRVATAKAVHDLLQHDDHDVVLLTGRMRPLDRDEVVREWLRQLAAREPRCAPLTRPVFVVATQCLEVGADLDFDGLVTECASLDALRQRFGRLNRTGRAIDAQAAVLCRSDHARVSDPVYGDALTATWSWLRRDERDTADMGVTAMDRRLTAESAETRVTLLAPAPDAPVLLPAYLDAWVQTPAPAPDPDVGLFLHGPRYGAPDVRVCWRADLSLGQPDVWVETLALCPPAAPECMPVPLWLVRCWMDGASPSDQSGDVEGVESGAEEAPDHPQAVTRRKAVRWYGPHDSELTEDPMALRPGDTVVLPAASESWNLFGHVPPAVIRTGVDRGEEAGLAARSRAVVRLTPHVPWLTHPSVAPLLVVTTAAEIPEDLDALQAALAAVAADPDTPAWLRVSAAALAADGAMEVSLHPAGGLVLEGAHRLNLGVNGEWSTSEGERSSRGRAVDLATHLGHAEDEVARTLGNVGMPSATVGDLKLAARFHDVGKADPRFQALLYGGNRITARAGPLLAKSPRLAGGGREQEARRRSGYPTGARHELLSVRLLESQSAALAEAHDRDLVLHLIASHHGHCRPYAPAVADENPESVSLTVAGVTLAVPTTETGLERLDSGVAERFWRLVRRYGWWGLAFLEATVRLADHRASEAEDLAPERVPKVRSA